MLREEEKGGREKRMRWRERTDLDVISKDLPVSLGSSLSESLSSFSSSRHSCVGGSGVGGWVKRSGGWMWLEERKEGRPGSSF